MKHIRDNPKRTPPPLPEHREEKKRRIFPELSYKEALGLIQKRCAPCKCECYGEGDDKVIILPMATQELNCMLHWGEKTPVNCFEQLYQGMGHIFEKGGVRVNVVSHFLYIYAAERTPTAAHINGNMNDWFMRRIEYERNIYNRNEQCCNRSRDGYLFDPFVEEYGPSEPNLYGHTHPDIGVFLSPPDRKSGFQSEDLPAVTFVADPIRKEMLAAVGMELKPAQVIALSYDLTADAKKDNAGANTEPGDIQSELKKVCNELLAGLSNAKGKFRSNRTLTGERHISFDIKWRPE